MRVFVAGASGALGSRLVPQLIDAGHRVIGTHRRPQSEELHMALKKLGVPTEFFVYPGNTHGIPDPRNRLLKSVAEKAWMDKWILGKGDFRWRDVLKTLEDRATSVSTMQ